jgi:uncharacterized protein YkwD
MFVLVIFALLVTGCAIASASTRTYTVQPGDTLAKIASAHDTTVDGLVKLNQETYPSLATDPGVIEVGWQLEVPGSSGGIQVTVKKTPSLGSGPTATPMDQDAFEMEVVRLVNEERSKAGLAPLEIDPGLMQFAGERSEDMVEREYFGHNDPVTGEVVAHRVSAGENITKLLSTTKFTDRNVERTVGNWISSDGHYENIVDPGAHRTGIGAAIGPSFIVVTQVFQ